MQLPRLTRIGVGGYKSIRELQPLELRPVNVLVGANGSGKSNLISFLKLLNAIGAGNLQEFIGLSGGSNTVLHYGVRETPAMWISLAFTGKTGEIIYFSYLKDTGNDSLIFSGESIDSGIVDRSSPKRIQLGSGHKESLLLSEDGQYLESRQLLSGIQVFDFDEFGPRASIRRRGYIEDNRNLRSDGGNLAAFLWSLKQRKPIYYRRIVAIIQQALAFFEDFDLSPLTNDPNSILLNWRDRNSSYLFGPHQLSSGALRAMALVALLAQPDDELPGMIVLDEPETGLHPFALDIIAALIRSASKSTTVVVATQSVAMVNHFSPSDILTVNRKDAASVFERVDLESLTNWLEDYSLGEIWEKNLIGGTP